MATPLRVRVAGGLACTCLALSLPVQFVNRTDAYGLWVALAAIMGIAASSMQGPLARKLAWVGMAPWLFLATLLLRASTSAAAYPAWLVALRTAMGVAVALSLAGVVRQRRGWGQIPHWIFLFTALAVAGDGIVEWQSASAGRAWWSDRSVHGGLPSRVGGLFANPNLLGAWTAVMFWVLLNEALRMRSDGQSPLRWPFTLGAMSCAMPLLLSQSRGAWGAWIVGCLVFIGDGTLRRTWKLPSLRRHLAVVILGLFLVGGSQLTLLWGRGRGVVAEKEMGRTQRWALLRGLLRHVKARLPFGSGIGSFSTVFPRYRVLGGQYPLEGHGDLLHWSCEGGPLLALAFALCALGAVASQKGEREMDRSGPGMPALVTLGASSFFVTWSAYVSLAVPAWCLLGLSWADRRGHAPTSDSSGEGAHASRGFEPLSLAMVCLALGAFSFWGAVVAGDRAYARARELAGKGDLPASRLALATAFRGMPLRPELAAFQAQLCLRDGDRSGALRWMGRARGLDPEQTIWLRFDGEILVQLGRIGEARRRFEEALALDPMSEALMTRLARLDLREGRLQEAESLLQKALETNPQFLAINRDTYPQAMALHVEVLRRLGRSEEADREALRYQKLYGAPSGAR